MPCESHDFVENERTVAAFCYATDNEGGVKCHSLSVGESHLQIQLYRTTRLEQVLC